ncbi:MAG: amidohydrolase family protein [Steroidobacteraceae bacterium]
MNQSFPRTLHDVTGELKSVPYKRIATEEAFCPSEMLDIYRKILASGTLHDPGFREMFSFYLNSDSLRAQQIRDYLVDLGQMRLAHMDERGIDMQVIALTSPGVQVMEDAEAVSFAAFANDVLADACRRHSSRFAGLAAVAPQVPGEAAKELERSVRTLGLKGAVIHSHTFGEYMDDQKFWPIFEAAEALDTPIYLHPQVPPPAMVGPFLESGLDGAIFGFGVETGLHLMRIIVSGAFDRFPNLKFVVGHLGEALPFWMYRLDYMHRACVVSRRYRTMQPIQGMISDYLRRNVYVTTSGFAWEPAIKFCQEVLGVDRVLYAMDYPYQHDVAEVIATDNLSLSDEVKAMLFQVNAERVFKL